MLEYLDYALFVVSVVMLPCLAIFIIKFLIEVVREELWDV